MHFLPQTRMQSHPNAHANAKYQTQIALAEICTQN